MGEVVLAVGASWGPDSLSEEQLQRVLADLTAQMLAQQADVTVLRQRPGSKPGHGTEVGSRSSCLL